MLAGAADTFVSPLSATSCNAPSFDTLGYELIVGVSCLLWSSAMPGVWSFLRVTPPARTFKRCMHTCILAFRVRIVL